MSNQSSQNQKSTSALREEAILAFWQENNIFEKTLAKEATRGDFIFYDGPPTANGMPGLHHIEPQSFKDIIPRYKTMQGFHVPRKAGWDTHGLPVELQVEKALGLKSKKEIEQYGVALFNQACKESVWKYKEEWIKMRTRMGFWTDTEHAYVTYTNDYIEALWSVVGRAHERGHLYKDFKVVPWCTRCGTALSSHELSQPGAYKDVKDLSVYVKFKVKDHDLSAGSGQASYILAWTTTPWTLPGNVALAVGNDIAYVNIKVADEHYILAKERLAVITEPYEIVSEMSGSELVGLEYEPLYPFLADIIPDKATLANAYEVYAADFVTTTDGTGVVHTAVMYGADDFELGTKYGLPKVHLVNEEGKFVTGTDFLEGRYVKEKDENGKPTLSVDIITDLKARNLFFKQENILHSYPHCWRCDTPLIYYARTSWYFRMSALREQLLVGNETINWEPKHIKHGRFGEWLDGIKDWAISRDRYWGTPLPIWENADKEIFIVDTVATLKQFTKKSGNTYYVMRHAETEYNTKLWWSTDKNRTDVITEQGKEQLQASANTLKERAIDLIIVSPFSRAQQTAATVAGTIGLDAAHIVTDERLSEWNVGSAYDGKPLEEYFAVRNAAIDRYGYTETDGESYKDVFVRASTFLYDIEKTYADKRILIISHGAVTRALELASSGVSFDKLFVQTRTYHNFANAEVRQIDFVPLPHNEHFELDMHKPFIDEVVLVKDGKEYYRTKEVMDVWFDSGAMPYAQAHVLGHPTDFTPAPADYISEAIDQTRGWFYTLHAVANLLSDTRVSTYKNVICLGHILDVNGQKMSKSKGNVVDPWDIFARFGADAIRLWMYSVNAPGDSKNFDEKTLNELNSKVFTILYNVLSFYELYRDPTLEQGSLSESTHVLDQWILARLNQFIALTTSDLDAFELFHPVREMRSFIDDLSTWYLRRSRERIKDGDSEAKRTLYTVLKTLAQIMAPFAPFAAEDIWQKLKTDTDEESVHLSEWPAFAEATDGQALLLEDMNKTREICTEGNALRKKHNIPVRQPLQSFSINVQGLESYYSLITDELNVKEIIQGDLSLDTTITPELKREGEYRELVRVIQDLRKEKGLAPSDMITLTLPEKYKDIVEAFSVDLKKTVGATDVALQGEEVIIG